MARSVAILVAIGIGLLVPVAGQFSFLIRYSLMAMLFFSFLEVRFSLKLVQRVHLLVVALNLSLPLLLFAILHPFNPQIALAVFAIAAAPTAAVAPVMAGFLRGNVSFVTAAVLLTSPVVALVLPFMLPLVVGRQADISIIQVALPIISIIFLPLLASLALRWLWPGGVSWFKQYSGYSFILFLFNVFVAAASAAHFAHEQGSSALSLFAGIGLVIALLCLLQFRIGEWIGRPALLIEAGLSLGRKNTMFGIWLALTFISPVAALGPMFYILYQNLYNSWQLYRMR